MEEQKAEIVGFFVSAQIFKRYNWDCMAMAIYFGNKEIIKILEEKGIKKGKIPAHIEAAILSYRNEITKEIMQEMNEKNKEFQNELNNAIISSAKSNNIKGAELLISKGADINAKNIIYKIYLDIIFY